MKQSMTLGEFAAEAQRVKAVTRYSQDVESYDRADELEEMGGNVIELPTTAWTAITEAKAA